MILPTIHFNGTARASLDEQIGKVLYALREAKHAMTHAAPNGRDYYPQNDSAIHQATAEHRDRVDQLCGLIEDYERIYEHILWSPGPGHDDFDFRRETDSSTQGGTR